MSLATAAHHVEPSFGGHDPGSVMVARRGSRIVCDWDPLYLVMAFRHLFPFGFGHPGGQRTVPVALEAALCHVLATGLDDAQFCLAAYHLAVLYSSTGSGAAKDTRGRQLWAGMHTTVVLKHNYRAHNEPRWCQILQIYERAPASTDRCSRRSTAAEWCAVVTCLYHLRGFCEGC